MGNHSPVGPSTVALLMQCPGSYLMRQFYPSVDTPETIEGNEAHDLAAQHVMNSSRGGLANSGNNAVDDYVYDVKSVMVKTGVFIPHVEERVECPTIHELSWGTVDCWLYDKKTMTLYIWDFKYGHSVVEVFENWQLLNYSNGILNQLEIDGLADQVVTVDLRIVQPRSYHHKGSVRSWVVKASELRGYYNQISQGITAALKPGAKCVTGPECKNCSANYACEAALKLGADVINLSTEATPVNMTPLQTGVQLKIIKRALKHLEGLESALEANVESLIKNGVIVPGWGSEVNAGRIKWVKPFKEVKQLGEMYNIKLTKDELITPLQAKKLGVDESVIMAYSKQTTTGVKIVEDTEQKIREVFTK